MRTLAPLLLVAFLCAHRPAGAADASAADPASPETGVVTAQMVTVSGHEFFQFFMAAWREIPDSEAMTLAMRERPSARWGSEVWIESRQRRVFQARLPIARADTRRAAERAADATWQAVAQAERERSLIRDADLAPDEF